jgi:hypothetical protein
MRIWPEWQTRKMRLRGGSSSSVDVEEVQLGLHAAVLIWLGIRLFDATR